MWIHSIFWTKRKLVTIHSRTMVALTRVVSFVVKKKVDGHTNLDYSGNNVMSPIYVTQLEKLEKVPQISHCLIFVKCRAAITAGVHSPLVEKEHSMVAWGTTDIFLERSYEDFTECFSPLLNLLNKDTVVAFASRDQHYTVYPRQEEPDSRDPREVTQIHIMPVLRQGPYARLQLKRKGDIVKSLANNLGCKTTKILKSTKWLLTLCT